MKHSTRRDFLCALAATVAVGSVGCRFPTSATALQVDREACTGCGRCPEVCNADAIRMIGNKAVIDAAKCVECGKCVHICPVNAIY